MPRALPRRPGQSIGLALAIALAAPTQPGCTPEPAPPEPAAAEAAAAPNALPAPRPRRPRPTSALAADEPLLAPPPQVDHLRPDAPRPPLDVGTVGGPDFTRVFEAVAPSVVGVVAGRLIDGKFSPSRTGTGFVWDADGHIVTNAHIIGDAPRVRVRSIDGRVTRARIVGLDAATDLAVLAPGKLGLPAIVPGPIESVRPGAWVAAVGNPQGMAHSITVGVVSALGRRILPRGAPKLAEFIQSDVAVDQGSSGGPLVDVRGRTIGLNTALVGKGLTFSTRIDMVATVARRLIAEGEFVRGFAGLYTARVGQNHAQAAGLERRRGVRVRGVVKDGPAYLSGVRPGDILLVYGTRSVDEPDALPWLIAATRPGTVVPCQIARGTDRLTLDLTVGEAQH